MAIRAILSPFRKRNNIQAEAATRDAVPPCPPDNRYQGLCNICGSREGFCHPPEAVARESYHCLSCSSTSRDRQLVKTLGLCLGRTDSLADWPEQQLTLIETSGYRATPSRLAQKFRYVNLMYDGAAENCLRGDLSRLGLRNDSLDVLLTSDVFEHVRQDIPAWQEVYRVLKPGGYLVLQVPAIGEFATTQVRVEVRDGRDVYLMEPEYHAENTLVYRYYGDDLYNHLRSLGFAVLAMRASCTESRITEQTIVVAQKAQFVSFAPSELSGRCWT
jgi:SAM-dependent methyltransferase